MPEQIIVDTSVIIALSKINCIELITKIYDDVFVPLAVSVEFGENLPLGFQIKAYYSPLVRLLVEDLNLGKGESEVISMSIEMKIRAAIDDLKARKIAQKLDITLTGTIGILLKAHKLALIENPIEEVLKLRKEGFHISEKLLVNLKKLLT